MFKQHYSYMYRYSNTVSNVLINHSFVSYLKSVKSLVYTLVEIISHFITFLGEIQNYSNFIVINIIIIF